MTPHLREEQLAGYLYRTLTDAQRESLDGHLSDCATCRARLDAHLLTQRQIHYAIRETLTHVQPSAALRFDPTALRDGRLRRLVALPTWLGRLSPVGLALALLVAFVLMLPPLMTRTAPVELSGPAGADRVAPSVPVVEEGMVEVEGTRLFYRSVGSGPPLVFLHPAGYEHIIFLPHAEALADEYRLIFFDQRGSGRSESEGREEEFTIEQFVADLDALRAALGLDQIHLLGNGSGAMIAMRYALAHEEHVASLILVGPIPPTWQLNEHVNSRVGATNSPAIAQALADAHARALAEGTPEALAAFWRLAWRPLMADEAHLDRIAMDVTERTAASHLAIYASFYRSLGFWDLTDDLTRLNSPTLILHGAHDVVPLEIVEGLRDAIEDSRLVEMEHSGRMPFVEESDAFVDHVRGFLSGVTKGGD